MTDQEKKELLLWKVFYGGINSLFDRVSTGTGDLDRTDLIKALAEQAIVIECEVEHSKYHTIVKNEIGNLPNRLVVDDRHGTPGKAIAIILSLEKP